MGKSFAVILAWPETKCKQAGAWYDPVMSALGISKGGYYQVGHAAIILISGADGGCQYFDFGRYHAPKGYGRVRGENTDHELKVHTRITFTNDGSPSNISDLIDELNSRDVWHGEGGLHAGIVEINFVNAQKEVKDLIAMEFIPYGPFISNGTNCSRFVQRVALSGMKFGVDKLALTYPLMLTPTPAWNTRVSRRKLSKYLNNDFSIKTEIA